MSENDGKGDPRDDLWLAVCEGDHAMVETIVERPDLARGTTDEGFRGRWPRCTAGIRASPICFSVTAPSSTRSPRRPSGARISSILLDRGEADVGARSADGWTPLHLAAYFGHRETAAMLLDRGADTAARSANDLENTPLHAALAGGRDPVVELLVERGADVNAVANGFRPLDIADRRREQAMVEYLRAHGAQSRGAMTPRRWKRALGLGAVALGLLAPSAGQERPPNPHATRRRLAGRWPRTRSWPVTPRRELGVAVQSHWFGVGAIVAFAEAGVGAVAAVVRRSFVRSPGPRAHARGPHRARGARRLLEADPHPDVRQVGMIDAAGRVERTPEKRDHRRGHQTGRTTACRRT